MRCFSESLGLRTWKVLGLASSESQKFYISKSSAALSFEIFEVPNVWLHESPAYRVSDVRWSVWCFVCWAFWILNVPEVLNQTTYGLNFRCSNSPRFCILLVFLRLWIFVSYCELWVLQVVNLKMFWTLEPQLCITRLLGSAEASQVFESYRLWIPDIPSLLGSVPGKFWVSEVSEPHMFWSLAGSKS